MPLFGRRTDRTRTLGRRVLTAAAKQIDLTNAQQGREVRALRQSWQADAWNYRDSVAELGYAMRFSENCARRIRLTVGYYDTLDQNPTLAANSTAPAGLQADLQGLLDDLRGGSGGDAKILGPLMANLKVPGEAFLLGEVDEFGEPSYSVRSIDELTADTDGHWWLRDAPTSQGSGQQQGRLLDPETTFAVRLWCQHPRFTAWADSPMRQLLDPCEELLLASRQIRGALRSRLAGAGILAVATELDLPPAPQDGEDEDPETSPLLAALTEAMLTPIQNEGSASAVIPIIIRGPYDMVQHGLNYLTFDKLLDPATIALRDAAVGRLATGLDLPREVITGMADMNHWSAWQVDDSVFRHHVEPDVQTMVDALTVGYLRPGLEVLGYDPQTIRRCVIWYDPTELLTHPDRSKDALDAWDRMAISDDTLRTAMGWTDGDKPSSEEMLLRFISHARTWPPAIVEAIIHNFFPKLEITAEPGVPGTPGAPEPSAISAAPVPAVEPTAPTVDRQPGPPATDTTPADTSASITAASSPAPARRLSRQLSNIDRQLRDRLTAAAHTTLLRLLDRAGNRVRGKASRAVQASLNGMPGRAVLPHIGRETILASYGLDEQTLLDDEMADLQAAWDDWVSTGQAQALAAACKLAGLDVNDPRLDRVRQRQTTAQAAGWTMLAEQLRQQAADMMWTSPTDDGTAPRTPAAPTSLIRAALAIAGGAALGLAGFTDTGSTGGTWVGGIGTGATITDLLSQAGAQVDSYEWVYGISERSFEPHVALDGLTFTAWDDPALANDGDFPDVAFYMPGDHTGCFPPGTVVSAPPIVGATTRWYTGQLVEVTTAGGHHLTATPNHPVLTPKGWVAAGLLTEMDDVVRCRDAERIAALVDPHEYQAPARIEDVTGALTADRGVIPVAVPTAAHHFHGDGIGSDVHVVRADGQRRHRLNMSLFEEFSETALIRAAELALPLDRRRPLDLLIEGAGTSAHRRVGVGSTGAVVLGSARSVDEKRGLTDPASLHPSLDETLPDGAPVNAELGGAVLLADPRFVGGDERRHVDGDPTLPSSVRPVDLAGAAQTLTDQSPVQRSGGHAVTGSADRGRLSGEIVTDRVVHVSRRDYAGHVHNLHTVTGWYSADGFIVHNCACDVTALWVPPGEDTGDTEDMPLAASAAANGKVVSRG